MATNPTSLLPPPPVDSVAARLAAVGLAALREVALHRDEAVEADAAEEADHEEGVEVEAGLDQQLVDAALVPEGGTQVK